MCCVFTTLVFLGPRAGILIWYLVQPARWNLTFHHFAPPLLGSIFLPWTTLTYVAVAPEGLVPFDWILIGFAVFLDIFSYSGGLWGNRRRAPGYPY